MRGPDDRRSRRAASHSQLAPAVFRILKLSAPCKLFPATLMRIFVGVTDKDWFPLHASRANVDEVNFWRPSPTASFKALDPGELMLFKLHSPDNFIVGGGFFTKFQQLPVNLAWDAFRESNGVLSLAEMRQRIAFYRRAPIAAAENPTIGCILLAEPFFLPPEQWIASLADFRLNTVQGNGYDTETGTGRELWTEVEERLQPASQLIEETATIAAIDSHGLGKPQIVFPRLGQGSFRIVVTEAYERRCALTGERTLPMLDAAHIKPYPHQAIFGVAAPRGLQRHSDTQRSPPTLRRRIHHHRPGRPQDSRKSPYSGRV